VDSRENPGGPTTPIGRMDVSLSREVVEMTEYRVDEIRKCLDYTVARATGRTGDPE